MGSRLGEKFDLIFHERSTPEENLRYKKQMCIRKIKIITNSAEKVNFKGRQLN